MYGKEITAREDVPFTVLIPAFAISEIKTGFLIGFVIYLPFLVIDFAVASILTSLGMVMVSPMMFSLPLKMPQDCLHSTIQLLIFRPFWLHGQ
jgi:flagellar biosynthetic protein FliP